MISSLHIQNIVLVEQAQISFQSGFNVITGETGAGKSAVLRALALVLGERADTQALRRGADKGAVEASFDTAYPPALRQLLEAAGIHYSHDEPLILRRELTSAGKSRAFINNQLAQVSLLRSVGTHLVDIVSQHANMELRDAAAHRAIVDSYGRLENDVNAFKKAWERERQITGELHALVNNEAARVRQAEEYARQLEELDEANVKEGEEEELFAEYTRLANSDELLSLSETLHQLLDGEEQAVIRALNRHQNTFAKLTAMDSSLADSRQAYHNAMLELQEVAHTLGNYSGRVESDPRRAAFLDERLSSIAKLKKKYGPTIADVITYHAHIKQELATLQHADARIEELQRELTQAQQATAELASNLTRRRTKIAQELAQSLTKQLHDLNMPKVDIRVDIAKQERRQEGEDHIDILFSPNVGEKLITVRECASGGELSRLILALKAIMANKERTPTLIFDEVDANIGGETATVVGQKLADIGQELQLISITHFPQVARHAHHHIQIKKTESEGRTRTEVQTLSGKQRDAEILRMTGGKAAASRPTSEK